jgi:hypothetical protein
VPLRLVLSAFLLLLAAACGGERTEPRSSVDVTVTRADGSAAEFPNRVRAWCGPFDEDNADTEAVHVTAGKRSLNHPFWELSAVRADVEREPATTLPNSFVFTEPRGTTLFAYDNKPRGNELSSAEEESSGTIRVEPAGCDPGDTVHVTFDRVKLGSELHDLGGLSFDGEVSAVISEQ